MAVSGRPDLLVHRYFCKFWSVCADQWKCDHCNARQRTVGGRRDLFDCGDGPALWRAHKAFQLTGTHCVGSDRPPVIASLKSDPACAACKRSVRSVTAGPDMGFRRRRSSSRASFARSERRVTRSQSAFGPCVFHRIGRHYLLLTPGLRRNLAAILRSGATGATAQSGTGGPQLQRRRFYPPAKKLRDAFPLPNLARDDGTDTARRLAAAAELEGRT